MQRTEQVPNLLTAPVDARPADLANLPADRSPLSGRPCSGQTSDSGPAFGSVPAHSLTAGDSWRCRFQESAEALELAILETLRLSASALVQQWASTSEVQLASDEGLRSFQTSAYLPSNIVGKQPVLPSLWGQSAASRSPFELREEPDSGNGKKFAPESPDDSPFADSSLADR